MFKNDEDKEIVIDESNKDVVIRGTMAELKDTKRGYALRLKFSC